MISKFRFILLFFFCCSLASLSLQATSVSPSAQLRKLSLRLKGTNPSQEEYQEINSLMSKDLVTKYLSSKSIEYTSTNFYIEKMQQRLEELFRLSIGSIVTLPNTKDSSYSNNSSANELFKTIIGENLSWDNLLTSKQYTVFDETRDSMVSDFGFFKAVFPSEITKSSNGAISKLNKNSTKENDLERIDLVSTTDSQKAVLAGAITTTRFFDRYPTTKLNRNRKRAAALFRIFLCDDMTPTIIPSKADDDRLLSMALGDFLENHGTEKSLSQEKQHGTDSSCKSCHYKLDPAGKVFTPSSTVLNPTNSPGALVFKRADGTLVSESVSGLGELGSAIVRQPEYTQCQVRHFWNWFIGKDYPLSEMRLQELVGVFNKYERRPNDFVSYLVGLPEFYNEPSINNTDITIEHVKPILQRCHKCHESESSTPEFYKLPIMKFGTFDVSEKWLSRLSRELDLNNHGINASMPPEDAGWNLSEQERDLIAMWIHQGAKNEKGQEYLNPKKAKELVPLPNPIEDKPLEASFEDTYYRYLENHDFFKVLSQYFANSRGLVDQQCYTLSESTRPILGVKNPINGLVSFSHPTPAYIKLVQECALSYINNDLLYYSLEQPKGVDHIDYLPSDFLSAEQSDLSSYLDMQWSHLNESSKSFLFHNIVSQLLPKSVLGDETFKKIYNRIYITTESHITKLESEGRHIDVKTALSWITMLSVSSEEFLTY